MSKSKACSPGPPWPPRADAILLYAPVTQSDSLLGLMAVFTLFCAILRDTLYLNKSYSGSHPYPNLLQALQSSRLGVSDMVKSPRHPLRNRLVAASASLRFCISKCKDVIDSHSVPTQTWIYRYTNTCSLNSFARTAPNRRVLMDVVNEIVCSLLAFFFQCRNTGPGHIS